MDAEQVVRDFVDADPAALVGAYGDTLAEVVAAQREAALILEAAPEPVSVTVTATVGSLTKSFPRMGVCAGPPAAKAAYADVLRCEASADAARWLANPAAA